MARIHYPNADGADTDTSGGASDRGSILPSLGIIGISFDVFEQIIREIQRSVHVAMHYDSSPRGPGDNPMHRNPYQIFRTLDPMAKKEGLGTFYKRNLHAAMGNGRMEEICSKFGVKHMDLGFVQLDSEDSAILSNLKQVKVAAHHKLEARSQAHASVGDQEGKMMTRERKAAESQQSPSSKKPKHDQGGTTTTDEKSSSSSDGGGDFEKECQEFGEAVKQHLSVDKMREILKIKDQKCNSRVSDVAVITTREELLFFGPPNECAMCNTNLKFDGKQYKCYGFFNEGSSCTFKIRNPPGKQEETKLTDSVRNSPVDELLKKHQEIRVPEGYLLLYYRKSKLGSEKDKDAEKRFEEKGNVDDAIKEFVRMFEEITRDEFEPWEGEKKIQRNRMSFFPVDMDIGVNVIYGELDHNQQGSAVMHGKLEPKVANFM